jgi:heme-degrading monooxygenase HmoA
MYARMITGQTQRGQMGDFLTVCRDTILPALRQEQGFRNVVLLTEPTTDQFIVMVLWETESEARASEASFGRQQLPLIAHFLTGQPAVEGYNVSLHV